MATSPYKNVSFYGQGPLNQIQRDYAPSMQMAQQLMANGSNTAPVQSPLEGIARALQGGLGGYTNYATMKAMGDRQAALNTDMMAALGASKAKEFDRPTPDFVGPMQGSPGGTQGMIAELQKRNNPDALPFMMHLQTGQMQQEQAAQQAEIARQQKMADQMKFYKYQQDNKRQDPTKPVSVAKGSALVDPSTGEIVYQSPANSVGGYEGTSMPAQTRNIVLNGDPSSPEYASAYSFLAAERTSVNPATGEITRILPDMGWARKPTYAGTGVNTQPSGTPPQDRSTVTTTAPTKLPVTVRANLDKNIAGAATLVNALMDYKSAFKNAGYGEIAKSASGMSTPLNNAWTNAALLAKGDELYKLGVLSGPDLTIIQNAFPDPSTIKGAIASNEDMEKSVDGVLNLIQDRISAFQKQNGLEPLDIKAYAMDLRGAKKDLQPTQEQIAAEIAKRNEARKQKGQN